MDPDVADMWRTYRACQVLHCPPAALDEQPAELIDWLLAMDDMVHEIEQERANG